jgi:hypothetical protein
MAIKKLEDGRKVAREDPWCRVNVSFMKHPHLIPGLHSWARRTADRVNPSLSLINRRSPIRTELTTIR